MKSIQKSLTLILLLIILLSFATPAHAFDGRTGENMVIGEGEVIEDDLYIGARTFTLDGIVKGDLIVGAQTVFINGTVEGDLIVGAQTVVINGSVNDDARVFVAAVQLGPEAVIGGDLVAIAASVETRPGSAVEADLITGSAQALLAGSVGGEVLAGTHALELRGAVDGDVKAYVDITEETASERPMDIYLNDSPISLPSVRPGLTLSDGAEIGGGLDYTSSVELTIPPGSVSGRVTRVELSEEVNGVVTDRTPTTGQRLAEWAFWMIRSIVTLILFGFLLLWLFPGFMRLLAANLRAEPLVSLGWGAVLYAAVFFSVLAIVLVTVFLVVVGLQWNAFWLAWLLLTIVAAGFLLVTAYLTKIVVGESIGKWILGRVKPALVDHRFWPMIVGVTSVVLVIGLLRFPLLPLGFFSWFLNFGVILFGLGTLWVWGRTRWAARNATP